MKLQQFKILGLGRLVTEGPCGRRMQHFNVMGLWVVCEQGDTGLALSSSGQCFYHYLFWLVSPLFLKIASISCFAMKFRSVLHIPALEVLVWGHWEARTQLGSTAVTGSWRRKSNSAKSFPLFHNRNVIWREHIINSSCENGYRQHLQSWRVCCIKSKVVWRWALFDEEWYEGADSWRTY